MSDNENKNKDQSPKHDFSYLAEATEEMKKALSGESNSSKKEFVDGISSRTGVSKDALYTLKRGDLERHFRNSVEPKNTVLMLIVAVGLWIATADAAVTAGMPMLGMAIAGLTGPVTSYIDRHRREKNQAVVKEITETLIQKPEPPAPG